MYKSSFHHRSSISCTAATEHNLSKMKSMIIVALALVAVAAAAPAEQTPQIVSSQFDQQPDGSYVATFESNDGIERQEQGQLKEVLDEDKKPHIVIVVRGSYSYFDEDKKPVVVKYFADETGYHAEGDSIPKPARR